jgi:coenzyme F420-0:L-glutamate ligase / coenzyme F420-1:gamma-L-glutamate ligase
MNQVRIRGLDGIPEVQPGDDLGGLIVGALRAWSGDGLTDGTVFVVAQKVVSKAEGRIVRLESVEPSEKAVRWSKEYGRDPRVVEVVLRESRRIVRMERGVLVTETRHGYVCAHAGVDVSNAPPGCVVLLPEDPDRSARRLRERFEAEFGVDVAVIVSDTFGRPWRQGLTNVALGISGLSPFADYRGQRDTFGRTLQATILAAADELASAGELVMGKTLGVPVALIEGWRSDTRVGSGQDLLRPAEEDLFR